MAISMHHASMRLNLALHEERDSQKFTLSGAISLKHPESQSVAISRNQYEATTESQSFAISRPSHLHERERFPIIEHRNQSQSVAISGPSHLHERERFPIIEHRVDLTQGAVRRLEMRRDVPIILRQCNEGGISMREGISMQ
jgi:hypothetical protein